jgi:hypothetical protein
MKHVDVVEYFLDIAVRLKELLHTNDDQKFARNADHLREKLKSELPCKSYTLVLDDPQGRSQYNGNHFDLPVYGFWIVRKVARGDYADEDTAFDGAKAIMWKILSKLENDKEEELTGLFRFYDFSSVSYKKAVFSDNLAGIEVSFSAVDPVGSEVEYDDNDWV